MRSSSQSSSKVIALCVLILLVIFFHDPKYYYFLINFISFAAFLYDKQQCSNRGYRVSESILLGLSALGGWIGSLLGMLLLQHKLRKLSFIGMLLVSAFAHVFVVWKVLS